MRVLAIDSSGLTATVAVVEDEQTIAEYTVNYKKTHSQTLLPMIDEVKKMIDLDLSSIDAIAVSGGPGSFTGLRIGAATAKGLSTGFTTPGELAGAGAGRPGHAVGLAGHQTTALSPAAGTRKEAISAAFAISAFIRSNITERENAGYFREFMG